MKKQITSVLLTAALLLAGCSTADDGSKTAETTANSAITTASTESVGETELRDSVPELTFGGTDFRVLTGLHSTYIVDTFSREEDGDLLNDVLARRNMKLEERFMIDIKENVLNDIFGVTTTLNQMANADEDSYELLMQIDREALKSGMDGHLYSYADLPYLDLEKPWWNQKAQEDFSINDKLFFTYGDDNLVFFGATTVLVFNKEMAAKYKLENPYQLVYDGKWTYDKFMEMNAAVTDDLDGNGKMNIEDQWGTVYIANSYFANFWLQDGYKLVEKDDDDLPYFNVPGNDGLISRLIELAEDSKESLYWYSIDKKSDWMKKYNTGLYSNVMAIFSDGKSLFAGSSIVNIMDARAMEQDFGVLPYPAVEEKEPGYAYGSRTFGGFPYVVPITVENLDMVSAVMEACAYESYKTVIPVLYDTVIKVKNSRDEDAGKMLDLMRTNRITDLGEVYWLGAVEGVYEELMRSGNTNVASRTEKIASKVQVELDKAIEFFS